MPFALFWRRYVSWTSAILRPANKINQYEAVPFSCSHYSNYYVQEEADDGVVMESTVPVKDVSQCTKSHLSRKEAPDQFLDRGPQGPLDKMTQEISVERHWPLLADYRLGFKGPLTLLESLARNGFQL